MDIIADRRWDYNEYRPHSFLGNMMPRDFAVSTAKKSLRGQLKKAGNLTHCLVQFLCTLNWIIAIFDDGRIFKSRYFPIY